MTSWEAFHDNRAAQTPAACAAMRATADGYIAYAKVLDEVATGICGLPDGATFRVVPAESIIDIERRGRRVTVSFHASHREVQVTGGPRGGLEKQATPARADVPAWARSLAQEIVGHLLRD